ncbi:hypothetical protein T440DRAFT_129209 [Plenodomus tracheiphilus IPT5]|uniref:Uncharacterized protein n=1 Tax=Plenodomus tracheiphilus IPT5 TaxID=1408161 RepID=A0A6A7B509_9PLEO|nr:hypothetical protein T440DRAFT_129209 [Plenodomus tracheiphilus IPT5]
MNPDTVLSYASSLPLPCHCAPPPYKTFRSIPILRPTHPTRQQKEKEKTPQSTTHPT